MSDLTELLRGAGLASVLVVDDAFDPTPLASDIADPGDVWATFNDDLRDSKRDLLLNEYPKFDMQSIDESYIEDEFVATVWRLRTELAPATDDVFFRYIQDRDADHRYLSSLQERLEAAGLNYETAGRDFVAKASAADIVIIDLFLGHGQGPDEYRTSIEGLRVAVATRGNRPPIVILMSRYPRLEDKRDAFRDDVGLLDSSFRVLTKAEIEAPGTLELQLSRLASSYSQTCYLATFVDAVDRGLKTASARTTALFRRLKLSDLGQIQNLILNSEGEPLGSYLVDVLDRVLLHEIEGERGIIDAALGLNSIDCQSLPAPYVAGSLELQQLVARVLTQNDQRLSLPGALESTIAFGDLFQVLPDEATPDGMSPGKKKPLFENLAADDVLLVITPACDLQREGAPRILMLTGKPQALEPKKWIYKGVKTPAIVLDGELKFIVWNLKELVSSQRADLVLAKNNSRLRLVGRLRESHAVALQQKVLSDIGRIGQITPLPATFARELRIYFPQTDSSLGVVPVPELGSDAAVVWVGRDKDNNPIQRLVTTEISCDRIVRAVRGVNRDLVASNAQKAFDHVQASEDLRLALERGIPIQGGKNGSWFEIDSPTKNAQVPKIGLAVSAKTPPKLDKGSITKAGVLLQIVEPVQENPPQSATDSQAEAPSSPDRK